MIPRIASYEQYLELYQQSEQDPEGFWASVADTFVWRKKWDETLRWNFDEPDVHWFAGGKLNISENCLDRHIETRGNQTALLWEPNNPNEPARRFTYRQLLAEVCRFALVLKRNGVKKGDRVCIYMPMVPELTIAVLACARIGAIHSVVFAGFSANALADRINDAESEIVITSDGNFRGSKVIPVKAVVDDAILHTRSVDRVIVLFRTGTPVEMNEGRDVWWHEEMDLIESDFIPAEEMDSEDMLFILYTSGSTGKPKGVVHTCGGYMVYAAYSFMNTFQYQEGEVHFCTADIGWITGHSYIVYGPLLTGATTLMFEGVPNYPTPARFWQIVQKRKVNILYTAPTAIRALMAEGDKWTEGHDFSSLRVLGTVGEPINAEAWQWYRSRIGGGTLPICDTWWQTETGGIMISALAGISPMRAAHTGQPLPGIFPVLLDANGLELQGNDVEGLLCVKFPWPSIIRTTYGDHERCRSTYFSAFKGYYFTGDGARRDENGLYRIIGRVDDVINVSGHRIGTAEVENAINCHPLVVESAVVGFPHDIKGQGIYAYVIARSHDKPDQSVRQEILQVVSKEIGPIAKPDKIQFVSGLPKTRSGKIMRRILRKVAEGDTSNLGDTTTLLDPGIVDEIKAGAL